MRKNRTLLIVILGLLAAIGPFSIDMYLPGFARMAKDLHSSVAEVSLSLSSFFIGISVGQLFYGPLLDRFGRKPPLYTGLLVYILTSLGCAFAFSVHQLIILRFLQALGSCAGLVTSRAMVRDLFPVHESAKIFSHLMLVIGVSPIIAPTTGGWLVSSFGWHSVFLVLAGMVTTVTVLVYLFLPESRPADPANSLKPSIIGGNFLTVLKNRHFLLYAFAGGFASSGLYAYLAGSPYVFLQLFHISEKTFGLVFAGIAAGLVACSQINSLLLRTYSSEYIIQRALLLQSAAGIVLFILASGPYLRILPAVFLIFLFISAQGFVFPNTSALAMKPFSFLAGSASALLGTIQLGIGALSSALTSWLSNHTAMPMSGVMAGCSLCSLSIILLGQAGQNNGAGWQAPGN